ncbi:hypothetical protein [Flavobacterium magnum]|uniref:hypothetical protein n=1 Tax=Flavobacterium magnum TaxID=2162713 RepID=UPI0015E73908|nr:hypothetical protein [Flavobacterium magnum]
MKKIILIVAIVLVAVVGLTSFNGKEVRKDEKGKALFAELKGDPQKVATGTKKPD